MKSLIPQKASLSPMVNRTSLYEEHVSLSAKMFEFGGWEMPLWYSSINEEHLNVRNNTGMFDVSHMGKMLITGANCQKIFERLVTRKLSAYPPGKCLYTLMLGEGGRVIDDMIVTNISSERIFVVCNAGTRERVMDWISHRKESLTLQDLTRDLACIAVQGPRTMEMLRDFMDPSIFSLKRYQAGFSALDIDGYEKESSDELQWARNLHIGRPGEGVPALISRTGYTGEDGFEIFPRSRDARIIWRKFLEKGKAQSICPTGLGARDTLRLEKCYLLSGHDFDGTRTALEADAEFAIDWDHDFVGKNALEEKRKVPHDKLVAFESVDRGIPREGYQISDASAVQIGKVTSGTMSPCLGKGIGMGYVTASYSAQGTKIIYSVGSRRIEAEVVAKPFLKKIK